MYSFRVVRPINNAATDLQIAYPNQADGVDHLAKGLEQLIEDYNQRLPPSRLVFVCPAGFESVVSDAFGDRRPRYVERLASTTHVLIAPFDENGRLERDRLVTLKDDDSTWKITDEFLDDVGHLGVADLFERSKTILRPPHGYVFRKPSRSEKDIFVRAGNMLREPGSLPIFNHLLLRRLPPNTRTVYIDSFTILSFALSLQAVAAHFRLAGRCVPPIAIEDFHSYEISDDFRVPNERDYVVLISASTSGDLARKLCEGNQADPSRIIHLLGVGPPSVDDAFRRSCVYFKEEVERTEPSATRSQSKAVIEISTEEFLVAQGTPRPVRIGVDHVDGRGLEELSKPFYQNALRFDAPRERPGSYAPFTISHERAAEDAPVTDWVRRQVVHELPASVHTIVPVDESLSLCVAELLSDLLPGPLDVLPLSQLEGAPKSASGAEGSIVVIAHEDPELDQMNRAAVALRDLDEDAHRHYVVCYSFPASLALHERLKGDLLMGRRGPGHYGWSEYLTMPVGDTRLHEALVEHRSRYHARLLERNVPSLCGRLKSALQELGDGRSVPAVLFLPSTSGERLELRHGSIFLNIDPPEGASQVVVYAMVSAALQRAREPTKLRALRTRPELAFDDNPFVSSVLDPATFVRFSDGVLQASFLRSAAPFELDYSGSVELSRQFRSTCSSVLAQHQQAVGDASLEFLNALATEKVALREEDRSVLLEQIHGTPVLSAVWTLLTGDGELD